MERLIEQRHLVVILEEDERARHDAVVVILVNRQGTAGAVSAPHGRVEVAHHPRGLHQARSSSAGSGSAQAVQGRRVTGWNTPPGRAEGSVSRSAPGAARKRTQG